MELGPSSILWGSPGSARIALTVLLDAVPLCSIALARRVLRPTGRRSLSPVVVEASGRDCLWSEGLSLVAGWVCLDAKDCRMDFLGGKIQGGPTECDCLGHCPQRRRCRRTTTIRLLERVQFVFTGWPRRNADRAGSGRSPRAGPERPRRQAEPSPADGRHANQYLPAAGPAASGRPKSERRSRVQGESSRTSPTSPTSRTT